MLITEIKNRIGILTLNRQEKRNALSPELIEALKSKLIEWKNDENIKVIILKANGDAFCAGADLAYLQKLQTNTFEENIEDSTELMELFSMIYHYPKVIISEIQGAALAGGCGLATVTDFSFASEKATFGYTEARIGFIPAIVMIFLLRKIGEGRAKELLLSANIIDAEQAFYYGLINKVLPHENLEEYVLNYAQNLCDQNSAISMKLTKLMINNVHEMPIETALKYAAEENARARMTNDCKVGIESFLNKQKPIW